MSSLRIQQVDFLAYLVDKGRQGCQQQGYSASGPSDFLSYQLANALLANPLDSPALEVCESSLRFEAESDCWMAITCLPCLHHASFYCEIDGHQVPVNTAVKVTKGQQVFVHKPLLASYWYLAVLSGFEATRQFESVSQVKREQGADFRYVSAGDRLVLRDCVQTQVIVNDENIKQLCHTLYKHANFDSPCLDMHYCYQHQDFSHVQKMRLVLHEFTVSKYRDRMGVRLDGPSINTQRKHLYSEGICYGAIQISAQGQPMILLNDRQTIGGYPKIGALGSVSAAKLAQLPCGTRLSFVESDVETLRQQYLICRRILNSIKDHVSAPMKDRESEG